MPISRAFPWQAVVDGNTKVPLLVDLLDPRQG